LRGSRLGEANEEMKIVARCLTCLLVALPGAGLASPPDSSGKDVVAQPAAKPLIIRPAPDGPWKAELRDVEKVLYSAANELLTYFPGRSLKPILVEPKGGPIVLFKRGPKGEYYVRLNTGETYWSQYAFQFAHEFCHILCNYTEADPSNKWFEESICELASLFALRRMAATWKTNPPYPNWWDYAPALRSYAENRINNARLPADTTLAEWYRGQAAELRKNPCLRHKNGIVAGALLPLFEKQPEHWEAVTYLNAASSQEPRSFQQYLQDWHKHCPEKHKPFVRQIAEQFGISVSAGNRNTSGGPLPASKGFPCLCGLKAFPPTEPIRLNRRRPWVACRQAGVSGR